MNQTIQNVSDTAFMVAGFRALESERSEPLFRDPLAAKLVGDHGKNILAAVPRRFVGAWSVVIRTVIIDDYIRQAIAAGVDTILNLGAGLDTRPYRIDLPSSLHWIEADFPHMIELKEARLAGERPSCRLDRIKLDLTDRSARRRRLADMSARATKILVLTEGVVPYLTNEDVTDLADDLRQMEKIGFWIIDYFSPEAIRYGRKMRARFMRNAPFQFEPKDWFGFSPAMAGGRRRSATSPRRLSGLAGQFPCLFSSRRGLGSNRCSCRARAGPG
jgi:methyltransferase (TIGR00027 family)